LILVYGLHLQGFVMLSTLDWRPAAAYLYILHLDGCALAWEYLRRNSDFRNDWQRQPQSAAIAGQWGLRSLENPLLDARAADPLWLIDADNLMRLTADCDAPASPGFDLWEAPGIKRLTHDGRRLLLVNALGHRQLRYALDPTVQHGRPVAYLISAGKCASRQWQTIEMQRRTLAVMRVRRVAPTSRPDRSALLHMRSLQALDGVHAGASQRTIAAMLFGADVIDARWDSDSELRNQVRYLLRRAQRYVRGGYRRLLSHTQ
jgi:hypothetical protein